MNGQNHNMKKYMIRRSLLLSGALLIPAATIFAQEATAGKNVPEFDGTVYTNPMFIALVCSAFLLMILIMVLGDIIKSSLHHQREMMKRKDKNSGGKTMLMIAFLLTLPAFGFAQDAVAGAEEIKRAAVPQFSDDWYGLDAFTFWTLIAFNLFELIIVFFFLNQIRTLLNKPEKAAALAAKPSVSLIEKLNASVSIEHEKDIMLDHNYDGIQELDNDLPPWWKYGFYITIIVSVIYMFHYHVLKTGALQKEELQTELLAAEIQKAEYKKKNANAIDENNVTFLTDEASIAEGKGIYAAKDCKACHGPVGEGTSIAPNLSDEYWIHGGSIQDIFKSIKYGWTEKGMKAWGQELNPRQMHVLASYVKSLKGSNPPNAKAPEGTIHVEEGDANTTPADSLQGIATSDSIAVK